MEPNEYERQPEYRRVVYLLRDGRDVMVSYFHHLRALGEIDDDVDLLRLVRRGDTLFPSRWDRHVEAWERNPFGAEKITIRCPARLSAFTRSIAHGSGRAAAYSPSVFVQRVPSRSKQ